jgi:lysophospholipase L1-like esterase
VSIKHKKGLANFTLLLASTLISLVVAEFAVRWTLADKIVLFPRYFAAANYDGVTLRRMVPNSKFWHTSIDGSWEFRINAQGFRDDQNYEYEKPAGRRRILVLGDSITEGYEVRQNSTFAKVLEHRLREKGIDAQVMNTGVSGFGTAEELMFLEHEGVKYHPDAIVVAFFANDFEDNVRSGLYELKNGKLVVDKTQYAPGVRPIKIMNVVPGASWLSQNSYLFSLFVNTVWETAKNALSAVTREQVITEYAVRVSEVNQYEQQLVVALLNRMKAVAHAANIPLVVVDIPNPDPSAPKRWSPSIPQALVPSIVSACDIFLPPSTYMAGVQGNAHVPHGHHHITEQTHEAIAKALALVLGEENFQIPK